MSGRRTGFLVGFFGALVLVATPAAGSGPAGAAILDQVTLNVWPSGQGKIEATPAGGSTTTCDYTTILSTENPCPVTLERGASVTVKATAQPGLVPPSSFVHWSRSACEGTGPCTFVVEDDGEWITAVFTPLRLEVGICGDGTVEVETPPASPLDCGQPPTFGDHTCKGSFAAEQQVVLVAKPTTLGDPIRWKPGSSCEPEGGDFSSSKCTVTMTNIRTFASVAIGDPATVSPPDFPFQITVKLKVKRSGSGTGSVGGSGKDVNDNSWSIACGAKCSEDLGYQSRVTLKADPAAGSRFVRWVGVCGTDDTCRFAAGSVTTIEARFDVSPPPPPPPPPPPSPPPPVFAAKLVSVSVRGTGARRAIVFVLLVDRPARVNARLLKRSKTKITRSYGLAKGRNARRLAVPRKLKPGMYRLSLKVVAGGVTRPFTKRIRLRR